MPGTPNELETHDTADSSAAIENQDVTPAPPPAVDHPRLRRVLIVAIGCMVVLFACSFYYYRKIGRVIDERLGQGPFAGTMNVFSAPERVAVGDAISVEELTADLIRIGYSTQTGKATGWYARDRNSISMTPCPGLTAATQPCVVTFAGGKVASIQSSSNHQSLKELELPASLLANLSANRERRRLVRFEDIPPRLVHAVISAEDKRFFEHSGLDLPRVIKAGYVDVRSGRKEQGASTLTMQMVRNFWLDADKKWKRKLLECLITVQIEYRLSKQQIFEYYSNQVYLGRRNTFSISGFAEGAHAYFDKDLSQLDDSEAALLAGLIQRPSYYNPFRYPDRAKERRDIVLTLMRRNGYLSEAQYRAASNAPLRLRPEREAGDQSYYFLDLVRDEVQDKLEAQQQAHAVYTTLDIHLQEAAEAAVRQGMLAVDKQLRRSGKGQQPVDQPQVALVALDPHTGAIKALVGGRDYRTSQLNHAIARRQPGSVFKPFVYAAALSTAVDGGKQVFTPSTMVDDEASDFGLAGVSYQPRNYHNEAPGPVTIRYALAHSLNIPAVSVANAVGLDRVVRVARGMGLNSDIKATPAVALGAYETTPLEIAGAYTAFANQGTYVEASLVSEMRDGGDRVLYNRSPKSRAALDKRVAYLMVNMMQDVLNSGTGASVHSFGFAQPAAGKTGTSRDGWFAGFTSQLLCVVWVGFDDNRDLKLEGARSALPIWAEFMKRASHLGPYRDAKQFNAPSGIRRAQVCEESGDLAGEFCTKTRTDVFIDGSEPTKQCSMHQDAHQATVVVTTPHLDDAGH